MSALRRLLVTGYYPPAVAVRRGEAQETPHGTDPGKPGCAVHPELLGPRREGPRKLGAQPEPASYCHSILHSLRYISESDLLTAGRARVGDTNKALAPPPIRCGHHGDRPVARP